MEQKTIKLMGNLALGNELGTNGHTPWFRRFKDAWNVFNGEKKGGPMRLADLAYDVNAYAIMLKEERRQEMTLCLIASENYASEAVRAALATVLTNKVAEGYPSTLR